MSLLRINNLTMEFGGQRLMTGLNAELNAGDHIGLVGPNGTGKTTLLRVIMRELEPAGGHIAVLPGLRIGYLPQQVDYPAGMTAREVVSGGLGALQGLA
ncbi:MAG: ABC-F family ATP-binding cassette domain-containing protein, partial [Calditrichaeota bacterium]|nr:ABC-F family ATP-binding cassette domain-containing protein [Calditrichota bacterium]